MNTWQAHNHSYSSEDELTRREVKKEKISAKIRRHLSERPVGSKAETTTRQEDILVTLSLYLSSDWARS